MRKTFVYRNGKIVRKQDSKKNLGPQMICDIPSYRSIITGEIIEGRHQHRDHLKRHHCIEVGNESFGLQKNAQT